MAEHPDVTHPTAASSAERTATSEILAVITAEEPGGATANQVALALGLDFNGEMVQSLLEELVAQGGLDRRGIGDGAVYTLNPMA